MSQVKIADRRRRRGLWPVMGFVLVAILIVLSYFIAPTVIDVTKQLLPQFTTRGTPPEQVRLMFSGLIFLVLISLAALMVAIFLPKRLINVREKDLVKERQQMNAAKKRDRQRQRRINRELKNVRRD